MKKKTIILFLFLVNLSYFIHGFHLQVQMQSGDYTSTIMNCGLKNGATDGYDAGYGYDALAVIDTGIENLRPAFDHTEDWGAGAYLWVDYRGFDYQDTVWKIKTKWRNNENTVYLNFYNTDTITDDYTAVVYGGNNNIYYNLKETSVVPVTSTPNGEKFFYLRVIPKNQIPHVESIDADYSIELYPEFEIELSKDLDESTLSGNVKVVTMGGAEKNISYNYAAKKIVIKVNEQLTPDTSYRVILDDDITDIYGNPLDGNNDQNYTYQDNYIYQFTTPDIELPTAELDFPIREFYKEFDLDFVTVDFDSVIIEYKDASASEWTFLGKFSATDFPYHLKYNENFRKLNFRHKVKSAIYWGDYREYPYDILIDKVPPITTIDYDGSWKNEAFSVNFSKNDNGGSGFDNTGTTFYRNIGSAFSSGTYYQVTTESVDTLYYYSRDDVGNSESVKKTAIKYDATAPNILSTYFPDFNMINDGDYIIDFEISDNLSGVAIAYLTYASDDGSYNGTADLSHTTDNFYTASLPKPANLWQSLDNQIITFDVYIEDIAGNVFNQAAYYSELIEHVNLAPIFPNENLALSEQEGRVFQYQFIANDPNLEDEINYFALDIPFNSELNTETGDFQWGIKFSQEGDYNFKILASDGELTDTLKVNFTVEDSLPKTNVSFPTNDYVFTEISSAYEMSFESFLSLLYPAESIRYRAEIFNQESESIFDENVNPPSFMVPGDIFEDNHSYNLRLYLILDDISYGYDEVSFAFDLPNAPEAFSLISPADNTISDALSIDFLWHEAYDPDTNDIITYEIEFSEESNFSNILYSATTNDTLKTLNSYDLIHSKTDSIKLYWRVKAEDSFDFFTYSTENYTIKLYDYSSDYIQALLPAENTIFNQNNSINFTWDSSSNVLFYKLIIEREEKESLIFDNLTNTFFTVENPGFFTDDSDFSWHIEGKSLYNAQMVYSDTLSFATYFPEAPNSFSLISPLNNSNIDETSILFQWDEAVDNDPNAEITYHVIFSDEENLENIIYTEDTSNNSLELSANQFFAKTDSLKLYWSVTAEDNDGLFTNANEVFMFNLYNYAQDNLVLISPASGSVLASEQVTFLWDTEMSPISKYSLYMKNMNTDEEITIDNITEKNYTYDGDFIDDDNAYQWKVTAYSISGAQIVDSDLSDFSIYIPEAPSSFFHNKSRK